MEFSTDPFFLFKCKLGNHIKAKNSCLETRAFCQ